MDKNILTAIAHEAEALKWRVVVLMEMGEEEGLLPNGLAVIEREGNVSMPGRRFASLRWTYDRRLDERPAMLVGATRGSAMLNSGSYDLTFEEAMGVFLTRAGLTYPTGLPSE